MKNNITFTSTLSNSVMKKLRDYADKYKTPKNKIIESALVNYFDEHKRADYAASFARAKNDPEVLKMAEEGMEDYLQILDKNK